MHNNVIKLSILATQFGIPIPDLLKFLKKLINKQCPKCDEVNLYLRKVHELGPAKVERLIKEVFNK